MSEHVVRQHPVIEELFSLNAAVIGKDVLAYKNHVYRVFNYCLFLDGSGNEAKYAIAAFFHDIGIWTNNTFDYLAPSIALAGNYLRQTMQEEWTDEISRMIDNHHKISFYSGKNTLSKYSAKLTGRMYPWDGYTLRYRAALFSCSENNSPIKDSTSCWSACFSETCCSIR